MPNPRNALDFSEIDNMQVTYKIDNATITYSNTVANGSAQVGLAVTLSANGGVVALAGDGTAVAGKLINVAADGFCSVQVRGFCQLPGGAAATLTRGTRIVGAVNGTAGYIRSVAAPGAAYAQAAATEATVARGTIIDPATTTAVWVDLG